MEVHQLALNEPSVAVLKLERRRVTRTKLNQNLVGVQARSFTNRMKLYFPVTSSWPGTTPGVPARRPRTTAAFQCGMVDRKGSIRIYFTIWNECNGFNLTSLLELADFR